MNYRYQIRRLVAVCILLIIFGLFVSKALAKSIDNQILEDTRMMEEHWELWRSGK